MTRKLLLAAALAGATAVAQVKISAREGEVAVVIDGKPFTTFYAAGATVMKPYLHPLRAASGTYVTRMWPMEDAAEEARTQKDHQHQRGLWFAHDSVNGLDFWNNEASYTTPNRGRIALRKIDAVTSGKERGSLAATFDWTDLAGKPQLTETRVMTFYAQPNLRTIDLDITLAAVRGVVFGDGKDGVLGIRLRPVLQEEAQKNDAFTPTGHISSAGGHETEKQAWGKPAKWCDYSGAIDGEKLGIAIFDHPANPRHPVRWHVRGYGLFAANPFGLTVFTGDKTASGAVTLRPGEKLRYRYRVVIHPGTGRAADLDAMWERYAGGR